MSDGCGDKCQKTFNDCIDTQTNSFSSCQSNLKLCNAICSAEDPSVLKIHPPYQNCKHPPHGTMGWGTPSQCDETI